MTYDISGPAPSGGMSRRAVLSGGSSLLAGFGLAALLPEEAQSSAAGPAAASGADLALFRPVEVNSTAYASTPGMFAVDGLEVVGVKGSGWRAAGGDPQWILVDLQGSCTITDIKLVFEAQPGDGPYSGDYGHSTGFEIQSSYATAFVVEVSADKNSWKKVFQTTSGTGGRMDIPVSPAATARYVRLTATSQSNSNPLGLNGFQVYGTSLGSRPQVTGWTNFPVRTGWVPGPLTVATDGSVPIESDWVLTMEGIWTGSTDGTVLSKPGVDTSAWLPATVPGTALASLVEQGQLPDPVSGMNNLFIPEALSRNNWWYRRTFTVPTGLDSSPGRRIWLEFDGINHQADIFLNGSSVGTLVHPFGRGVYDVTAAVNTTGANNLAVRIHPIPNPGSPGDIGSDGTSVKHAPMNPNSPTYLAASGWDWMPAVRDRASGIWNHVRLRSTGTVVVGDARVDSVLPNLPDTAQAQVTITVPVRNVSSSTQQVTVTAAFDTVSVSTTVSVSAGQTKQVVFAPAAFAQLRLTNPALWWPNGYGSPTLHELTMTATISGTVSDRKSIKFGIRQITHHKGNNPFEIVNGRGWLTSKFSRRQVRYVKMLGLTRATSYGYSLWTFTVRDSVTGSTDLAQGKSVTASSTDGNAAANAVDGNENTRWSSAYSDNQWIQVDLGSAKYIDTVALEWETAYAATYKVQVSTDGSNWTTVDSVDTDGGPLKFIVNGVPVFVRGGAWGWDELLRRMLDTQPGRLSRMDAVIALQRDMNFTILRNWIGSSYREELFAACDANGILVWNEFWEVFGTDPANHTDYLAQATDTVLRYRSHPCIAIWVGCNEGTPPTTVNQALAGIVSANTDILYIPNSAGNPVSGDSPWSWRDPRNYFIPGKVTSTYGFWSETGLPTVPVTETMHNLIGPNDSGWPIDKPWFLHNWSTNGNQGVNGYKAAIDARLGTSGSLDEFCRKAQFINYESMRAIFEAWNAHLWNNATGVMLWMSNPAWYSTVWQTYDYDLDVNGSYFGARKGCEAHHVQADLNSWQVTAVNHTTASLTNVAVTATLYDLNGKQLANPTTSHLTVAPSSTTKAFTVPFSTSQPALHLLRLTMKDSGGALLSENTYWRYQTDTAMQALNKVAGTHLSVSLKSAGTGAYTATVTNTGATVAPMVRLSLRQADGSTRVLPTVYGENYFWLLPGESRTTTVKPLNPVTNPRLQAQGYNTPATLS